MTKDQWSNVTEYIYSVPVCDFPFYQRNILTQYLYFKNDFWGLFTTQEKVEEKRRLWFIYRLLSYNQNYTY